MKPLRAVDLFAGAGGTSTGLARACERSGRPVDLLAINHWQVAVETHAANHPWADHLCADIGAVSPAQAMKGRRLDLLVASPECIHHSNARGGRPMSDQSRASAWHVVHWAESLRPAAILVENVREFATWGPLGSNGRPLASRKGETFLAWIAALESLGYRVEWKVLNSADYGDPTTRERLYVIARRGKSPLAWPEPTHAPPGKPRLFGASSPWRAAREIIDWEFKGSSIFDRKRPLAEKTLARIEEGLRRFGGKAADPFLVLLRGTGTARSIDRPVPAVTAQGEHVALCEPFMLSQQSGGAPRAVGDPVQALATKGAVSLVEPFIVPFRSERKGQKPRTHSVDEPMPTTCAGATGHGLVEPFILPQFSTGLPRSLKKPLSTITGTSRGIALVEPFLVGYYGNGQAHRVADPCPTVTTKDRFALVEPGARLDILFRMLTPRELARAMGFPDSYEFKGNRGDVVRQIGNAVSVGTAEALCSALVGEGA